MSTISLYGPYPIILIKIKLKTFLLKFWNPEANGFYNTRDNTLEYPEYIEHFVAAIEDEPIDNDTLDMELIIENDSYKVKIPTELFRNYFRTMDSKDLSKDFPSSINFILYEKCKRNLWNILYTIYTSKPLEEIKKSINILLSLHLSALYLIIRSYKEQKFIHFDSHAGNILIMEDTLESRYIDTTDSIADSIEPIKYEDIDVNYYGPNIIIITPEIAHLHDMYLLLVSCFASINKKEIYESFTDTLKTSAILLEEISKITQIFSDESILQESIDFMKIVLQDLMIELIQEDESILPVTLEHKTLKFMLTIFSKHSEYNTIITDFMSKNPLFELNEINSSKHVKRQRIKE